MKTAMSPWEFPGADTSICLGATPVRVATNPQTPICIGTREPRKSFADSIPRNSTGHKAGHYSPAETPAALFFERSGFE